MAAKKTAKKTAKKSTRKKRSGAPSRASQGFLTKAKAVARFNRTVKPGVVSKEYEHFTDRRRALNKAWNEFIDDLKLGEKISLGQYMTWKGP